MGDYQLDPERAAALADHAAVLKLLDKIRSSELLRDIAGEATRLAQREERLALRPGQEVSFIASNGRRIYGTVVRINQKTATLDRCHFADGTPAPDYRVGLSLIANT